MSDLLSLVAVFRSFNNPNIARQVNTFLSMGLGMVIVVVNAPSDRGATKAWLSDITNPRLKIIEMWEGYSWSNGLNIALMAIKIANIAKRQSNQPELSFVFTVSVEANFTKQHLLAMHSVATCNPRAGVVGTSFKGLQNSNEVSLGTSYFHPRNTGMLIRLEVFGYLGCFDAQCDALGGMEDINMILEMLALSDFTVHMCDLRVPLIVGVHYKQADKEQREQAAMSQIIAQWVKLFPNGTPERIRIDGVLREMGLEPKL